MMNVLRGAAAIALLGVLFHPAAAFAASPLPRLQALEDRAEAVAEGELSRPAAARSVAVIASQWPAVQADLLRRGVARGSVAKADEAIHAAAHGRASWRADANEVTGAFAPLFAMLGDPVPTPVHRLDYLCRAMILDAASGHWPQSSVRASDLRATWAALRPVVQRRNLAVATKFDGATAAAAAAASRGDFTALQRAGGRVSDGVDEIEHVFGG